MYIHVYTYIRIIIILRVRFCPVPGIVSRSHTLTLRASVRVCGYARLYLDLGPALDIKIEKRLGTQRNERDVKKKWIMQQYSGTPGVK